MDMLAMTEAYMLQIAGYCNTSYHEQVTSFFAQCIDFMDYEDWITNVLVRGKCYVSESNEKIMNFSMLDFKTPNI